MMKKILVPFIYLMFVSKAFALDPINTGFFDNLAIDGYDTTAYFNKGNYASGEEYISHDWEGVTWYFKDEAARDAFVANPSRYAPQYGGYCSNQMSLGHVHDTNPKVFLVHKDKLYLFGANMGRDRWLANDIDQMVRDADANWAKLMAE